MKELMLTAFILTAPATGTANTEGDAYRAIFQASYKGSGLEDQVNHLIERELRRVPKDVQKVVGDAVIVGRMIYDRKVTVQWSF